MAEGIISANADALLDAQRSGGANYNATAQLYVQAHTGNPGPAGTNNVSAGDATRKAINHNAPSGGTMTISNIPAFTNGGTSESLAAISVWTASSGGTCKYTAATPSAPWTAGQVARLTQCTLTATPIAS